MVTRAVAARRATQAVMRGLTLFALGVAAVAGPACGSVSPASSADAVTLEPVDGLLRWLEGRAQDQDVLRLPVVVQRDPSGLGRAGAFIGGPDHADAGGRLKLSLDDTRLGISLDTRLRSLCPPPTERCAVWLEGVWGTALPGPATRPGPNTDGAWPFTIHRVGEAVDVGVELRARRLVAKP